MTKVNFIDLDCSEKSKLVLVPEQTQLLLLSMNDTQRTELLHMFDKDDNREVIMGFLLLDFIHLCKLLEMRKISFNHKAVNNERDKLCVFKQSSFLLWHSSIEIIQNDGSICCQSEECIIKVYGKTVEIEAKGFDSN